MSIFSDIDPQVDQDPPRLEDELGRTLTPDVLHAGMAAVIKAGEVEYVPVWLYPAGRPRDGYWTWWPRKDAEVLTKRQQP